MTPLDAILAAAAILGFVFHLGWHAGSRWRRAYDCARYAQIERRRMARLVRQCESLGAGIAAAAAAATAIESRPTTPIVIDYSFAVAALARSGYEVVPIRPPKEGLH